MATFTQNTLEAPGPVVPNPFSSPWTSEVQPPCQTRSISLTPKAFLPEATALSKVFIGLAVGLEEGTLQTVVVVTDGVAVLRSEHASYSSGVPLEQIFDDILHKIEQYAQSRSHKIEIVALTLSQQSLPFLSSTLAKTSIDRFFDRTWLALDALPFLVPPDPKDSKFSLEGRAVAAIEEAVSCLEVMQSSTVRIQFSRDRQVLVDANQRVQLHSLSLLERISSPTLFAAFGQLSRMLSRRMVKVGFFSATPRGGGVALMRHSLMRLWQQVGVDVSWYVPPGDSNVFDVTKRKFHNILQGVAPDEALLTRQNRELFLGWAEWYFTTVWKNEGFLERFDVIVIDDPQVLGLVPYIRKLSPKTKIVYRSHIQIRADLVDQEVQQQAMTWNFLWSFIRQVDLFVTHPLEEFVPQVVKNDLPIVYMPPCTSPLDGLNKPIPSRYRDFYRRTFNLSAQSAVGREIDWSKGYILQIARFDPSKGIPDLVEAYRLFRMVLSQNPLFAAKQHPQLVLTGHSALDDPDAVNVIKALYGQLADPLFETIRDDIFAIRAPPSDRLLNTMLEGADVVCQVSIREGYEIKVSEAIHHHKWIIGTRAGGIPLQIQDGINGRLVKPNDPQGIADALSEFYISGKGSAQRLKNPDERINELLSSNEPDHTSGAAHDIDSERHFTLANSTMWEYLFLRLLSCESESDHDLEVTERGPKIFRDIAFATSIRDLNGQNIWEIVRQFL